MSFRIKFKSFKDFFKDWVFYGPFALLFCLIPYRVVGMLHFELYVRIFVLFTCLFFFLYFLKTKKTVVSLLLDNVIVQYFFYLILSLENLVWNMSPWLRYSFLFCLGFNLGAWPTHVSEDPTFYYMLFGFLYSFYARLKMLFLDPNLEGSVYFSPILKDEALHDLTWNDIVHNISAISFCFFGRPVSNQLGEQASKKSFPQIAKRYMFNRLLSAAKTNPELTGFAGALGGVVGYGVSEFNTHSRHNEVLEQTKNSIGKAARANDLKEVELKIISIEEYRSRFGKVPFQQANQVQVPTNLVAEKLKATSPIGFFDEMRDFLFTLIAYF